MSFTVCPRVCASSNAPSCSQSTTMSPTPASAPRPGGGVRGHTTRVGIAVTAAAAVAVAALPSDRPCPATGRPRQGLRRSRAVAHTHPPPRSSVHPRHAPTPAHRRRTSTSPTLRRAPSSRRQRSLPVRRCQSQVSQGECRAVRCRLGRCNGRPTHPTLGARLGDTRPRSVIRP